MGIRVGFQSCSQRYRFDFQHLKRYRSVSMQYYKSNKRYAQVRPKTLLVSTSGSHLGLYERETEQNRNKICQSQESGTMVQLEQLNLQNLFLFMAADKVFTPPILSAVLLFLFHT